MVPVSGLEVMAVALAGTVAAAFRPWAMLRRPALRWPWLAAVALLPWLWAMPDLIPGALPMQLSFAALAVLMFGWPLATWTAVAAGTLSAWLSDPFLAAGAGAWLSRSVDHALWSGVLPATLALGLGLATRRWLPHHLMVYILARGFGATLLAMTATGALWVLTQPLPPGSDPALLMIGRWLIAWGDAVATGMLTSVFVAFCPQWLATYSDRRYLPS